MRNIHYFPRYSQQENVVTNNTLLLFLRLMEFSRARFELFLTKLAEDGDLLFSPQWLHIAQQKATAKSVVDGYLAQDSIKIVVETKRTNRFSSDQLERHLNIFANEDHKLLVLLCPSTPSEQDWNQFRATAKGLGVEVLPTTFEKIIRVMHDVLTDRDEEILELVRDFEEFCSDTGLLPDDQYFMFTPPCGPSHKDNEELRLYYCPADRSRRNAAFLGIYADKQVRAIGRISKAVVCEINLEKKQVTSIGDESLTPEESARVLEAAQRAPEHGWDITKGHRFFLCDEWAKTSFRKASPLGIQGHRMLDLRKEFDGAVPKTVEAIAQGLDGHSWRQG